MNDKEYIQQLETIIVDQDITIAKCKRIITQLTKHNKTLTTYASVIKKDCIEILHLFNAEIEKQQALIEMYRRQT